MRTIKFRAWDKLQKKFLYPWPEGFHILGETTCFDLIGQQIHEFTPDISTLERLNDVELMQFTGLTDKDGKEIYEGDIVSCNWGINNQYNPAKLKINKDYINTANPLLQIKEVEFCELIGGFAIAFDWEIAKDRHKDILHLTRYRASIFIKVIGNIYENRELLNN